MAPNDVGPPLAGLSFAAKASGAIFCGSVSVRFILPALPKLKASPPTGEGWSYEVKFDGYRVQLHKVDKVATIYSKSGALLTSRFPPIAYERR